MRSLSLLCVALLLPLGLGGCAQSTGQAQSNAIFVPSQQLAAEVQSTKGGGQAPLLGTENPAAIAGQYIVVLRDGVAPALSAQSGSNLEQLGATRLIRALNLDPQGVSISHIYGQTIHGFSARLSEQNLKALRSDPRVKYVEQDAVSQGSAVQSPVTWGLDRIDQRNLPLGGAYTYNGTAGNVTAFIIDSGIYTGHPNFGGRASWGPNLTYDGYNYDCVGHGTHVAGTVGSATYGVAKSVRLVSVKVLGCDNRGSNSNIIAGINWAAANMSGPSVANMSITGDYSRAENDAVNAAWDKGLVMVIAAGNFNANACNYSPASAERAIIVGNVTSSDTRNGSSNYGSCLDIWAPGTNITSTSASGGSAVLSGTSMASPHVAGVAALYRENNPYASSAEVYNAVVSSATTGALSYIGTGSPNRMLYSLFSGSTTTPAPTPAPTTTNTYNGYLYQGRAGYAPSGSGFSYAGGTLKAVLTGDAGTDFDLYLQRWNGSSWTTVATSEGSTSSESITYNAASGTYRWQIYAYSGSGNLTLTETK